MRVRFRSTFVFLCVLGILTGLNLARISEKLENLTVGGWKNPAVIDEQASFTLAAVSRRNSIDMEFYAPCSMIAT